MQCALSSKHWHTNLELQLHIVKDLHTVEENKRMENGSKVKHHTSKYAMHNTDTVVLAMPSGAIDMFEILIHA